MASKIKSRKEPEPVGVGKPIVPSRSIMSWYDAQIEIVTDAMIEDYRHQIGHLFDDPRVRKFYGMDISVTSLFNRLLKDLEKKWSQVFVGFAEQTSTDFVSKVNTTATSSTLFSLKTAGIKQPRSEYNNSIANTLGAAKDFNTTLITNISQDIHEKVYNSIMLSLTSPNPEEQGMTGIGNTLRSVGGFSKQRIKLITRDQTSKLYSAISDAKMRENGVDEFRWLHSSAGKVPRKTHVEKNNQIFKLDDPRLWEGPKSDQGPPGWAINCFPGDVKLQFAYGQEKLFRRWYDGELTEIVTDSGKTLRATFNHPILTDKGWVAIGLLKEGDNIVDISNKKISSRLKTNNNESGINFSDFFKSSVTDDSFYRSQSTTAFDFHGDGCVNSQVDIIDIDRSLRIDYIANVSQSRFKNFFSETNKSRFSIGSMNRCLSRYFFAAKANIRHQGSIFSLLRSLFFHLNILAFGLSPYFYILRKNYFVDSVSTNSIFFRQRKRRFSRFIKFSDFFRKQPSRRSMPSLSIRGNGNVISSEKLRDIVGMEPELGGDLIESAPFVKKFSSIVKVDTYLFSGHVYNLQTSDGWYVANGIIVHNCRCRKIPVIR